MRQCSACGEVSITFFAKNDSPIYCHECFMEVFYGIIVPPYGPLVDEDDIDDDLDEDGRIDNAIRAMEDTR